MAQLTPDFYNVIKQLNDAGYTAKATTGLYGIDITVTSPEGNTLNFSSSKTDLDTALDEFTVEVYQHFRFVNDDLSRAGFMSTLERRSKAWEAEQAKKDPDWNPNFIAESEARAAKTIADAEAAGQRTENVVLTREFACELLWRHQRAVDRRGLDRDPDLEAFLSEGHQTRQRRQSDPAIQKLIRALINREWYPTHQGLAVDRDGFLIDGQHRCMAVAISGIALPTPITWNMDGDKIFALVDIGKPRTVADIFSMLGIKYPGQVATVIRLLYYYDNEPINNWLTTPLSHEHLRTELTENYRDIGGYFERARSITASREQPVLLAPTALAAAIYIITRAWPDAPIEPFLTNLKNSNIDPYYHNIYDQQDWNNNPGHALARWANSEAITAKSEGVRRKRGQQKNSRDLVMILRAWNDICIGKVVKRYTWVDLGSTPVPWAPTA